jgi:hypothetical protein
VSASRTASVTRAALRHCLAQGWAPLAEVPLPDGSRADILALRPDGGVVILEVKSCARDFLSDFKWQGYGAWCDAFLFAVDGDFPRALLPEGVGVLLAEDREAALWRAAAGADARLRAAGGHAPRRRPGSGRGGRAARRPARRVAPHPRSGVARSSGSQVARSAR